MSATDGVVRLDTGPLNSDLDLGINARPADRLTFRKVTDCAILRSVEYSSGTLMSGDNNSTASEFYNYGPTPNGINYTYSLSQSAAFAPSQAYNVQ